MIGGKEDMTMKLNNVEILRIRRACEQQLAIIKGNVQRRGLATDYDNMQIMEYQRIVDNLYDLQRRMRKEQKGASLILDTE